MEKKSNLTTVTPNSPSPSTACTRRHRWDTTNRYWLLCVRLIDWSACLILVFCLIRFIDWLVVHQNVVAFLSVPVPDQPLPVDNATKKQGKLDDHVKRTMGKSHLPSDGRQDRLVKTSRKCWARNLIDRWTCFHIDRWMSSFINCRLLDWLISWLIDCLTDLSIDRWVNL